VIKPLHGIGKYGGTLRRGFTGHADGENGSRLMAADKILFKDMRILFMPGPGISQDSPPRLRDE
jgi:hypothetical protein